MKVDLVNEIGEYGGLWQSSEKVDEEIERLVSNEPNKVMKALHCQIKFHKEVLFSKGPKELFQKTVKTKAYTEKELIENLKQILVLNAIGNSTEKPKSLSLKPLNEIKQDLESLKPQQWQKLKSREKKGVQNNKKAHYQHTFQIHTCWSTRKLSTNVMMKIITLSGMMLLSLK